MTSKIDILKPISSWIISIESLINELDIVLELKRVNIISIILIKWVTFNDRRFRLPIIEDLSIIWDGKYLLTFNFGSRFWYKGQSIDFDNDR